MASGSTGAPDNIPFPLGADQYALTGDLQTMAAQIASRLGATRSLIDGKLTVGKLWDPSDNLNSWWESGVWGITGAQGMPEGVTSAIMLQVEAGAGAWQRLWISFGVKSGLWLQWGNEVQGVWHKATPFKPSDLDSALAHELRVQDLQRRRARTATAKGVVVFVLDHGYSGFMNKAWPDLSARGFPVTWALNTSHPTAIDTGGDELNWTAIKNLVSSNADDLEIAAHSATHGNITEDPEKLEGEIVAHKAVLEDRVGQTVDSWIQPGATLGDFVKDNPGSPDDYAGTTAGRMIAATYACATGYILTPRTFALDGVPDLGVVGNWIDKGVGSIMTYVNGVATNGGYTIVRMHPQYMDQSGYITRTQWRGFLDDVKALVDDGSVEVMTLRDASVATSAVAREEVTGLDAALAGKADTGHDHDSRYLNTVPPDVPSPLPVESLLDLPDGDYSQRFASAVTEAAGYPPGGRAGHLTLRGVSSGSFRVATYTPFAEDVVWLNRNTFGTWSGWRKIGDSAVIEKVESGIFVPTALSGSGANLNNLIEPGPYRLNSGSDGSLANNFPIDKGPNPVVEVDPWGTHGNVIQTVKYPRDHGVWMRGYYGGVWQPWRNVGPDRAGDRLAALEYDTGTRDITHLASNVAKDDQGNPRGQLRFRVKNGWARLDFGDIQFDTDGPTIFSSGGPLAAWAPLAPETGKGFVTEVNTSRTTRVTLPHNGGMTLYGAPANKTLNGHIMWPFDRTPPASPIGNPA